MPSLTAWVQVLLVTLLFSTVAAFLPNGNPCRKTETVHLLFAAKRTKPSKRQRFDDDYDRLWDFEDATSQRVAIKDTVSNDDSQQLSDHFLVRVQKAVKEIQKSAESKAPPVDVPVKENKEWQSLLLQYIESINQNLIERSSESRLVLLAYLAQEHILLIGAPGTAKSELGRRLDRHLFTILLTKFTTPEELFGPLSLQALEQDVYLRKTKGYLPCATVAFLDEIFKANTAILNALLGILNERTYNGERCPLQTVIAASNELPEDTQLEALYDRFLIRKQVRAVSNDGLMELLNVQNPATTDPIHVDADLFESIRSFSTTVVLSENVVWLLRDLREFMASECNVVVSDRRLVKACHLLKMVAASHGRGSVDTFDCLALQHVVWNLPEQHSDVQNWLLDHITPSFDMQLSLLLNNLRQEVVVALRRTSGDVDGSLGGRADDVAVIKRLRTEIANVEAILDRQSEDLRRHLCVINRQHLWLEEFEAKSAKQYLTKKGNDALKQTTMVLERARSLLVALDGRVDADICLDVIQELWAGDEVRISFTDRELEYSIREAKANFDSDTYRQWKRQRRKAA